MNQNQLVKNLDEIRNTIPISVRLVAVTKKVDVEVMKWVYEQGIKDFGENKLQEAINKQAQLQDLKDITWHFIGHLQSNKAKKAVESFAWIHSVDSLKIAQRLDFYAQQALHEKVILQQPQVCLQVKPLPDDNKYGWTIEQLWNDLPLLQELHSISVRGLMVILPLGLSPEETFSTFKSLKILQEKIRNEGYFSDKFNQLSMGMSEDYLYAIEAGSTIVRLGRIIFNDN
ncbi:YggS family pyridoxal phosphate-dependent enzyme [Cyanobacterium sp. Dongsha4]|uniref:YggS family pyridoxal phosphate-dependent enzyme n=1 Tax=Cyanobacterium sp. DS4 TaxID=2878255 RepID=UPI002E808DED|nr:YggS family pyridoxal phosphate-dependent enzyme [Cyanobacterium sp. Dongsha4]WVK99051.1 YggS family pyridoxal phosphate-dependent enzyme [Cyanobacterium sp. Dongsha4]